MALGRRAAGVVARAGLLFFLTVVGLGRDPRLPDERPSFNNLIKPSTTKVDGMWHFLLSFPSHLWYLELMYTLTGPYAAVGLASPLHGQEGARWTFMPSSIKSSTSSVSANG